MSWPEPVVLQGNDVRLVPLEAKHHAALAEAVQDGELWRLRYTSIPAPEGMRAEIARRLDLQTQGSMLPFAVIEGAEANMAGMTTYMNIDAKHRRLEIGSTWYRKSLQRTALNTQCKLLLLSHAFDELSCIAVEFRTHFLNTPSRRAIERLGAKLDGVLRSHQIGQDGTLRDTCVYSIVAPEWPTARKGLLWHLERHNAKDRA